MQLARMPAETSTQALDDLIGLMTAASAEALRMVAVYDRKKLWRRDGATCMASWLAARHGFGWGTAREWVRVAHALEKLPRIARAYSEARMSWDQLRPVTKLATPDTDEYWARKGPTRRPKTLQRMVERHEQVLRRDAEEARRHRGVTFFWNREGTAPVLHLSGKLPDAQGAAFEEALRARALETEVEEDVADATEARMADALVGAVTGSSPGKAAPPTLVVHVAGGVLAGEEGSEGPGLCETASGVRLEPRSVREIAKRAKMEWVLEQDGRPIGVGRQSRKPPEWLKHLVEFRDERTCVFPGCERKGYVKRHHVEWWGDGGPTDLDNLVVLCDQHHRMIHEGGWKIAGKPGEELRFHDPRGRPIRDRPPGIRPEIRERYFP